MPTWRLPTRLRLVLLSCLMLFVELALIRWTGSNVIFLSYFSNFVLLGSFLGIGLGFLRANARLNLFPYAPVALALFVGLVLIFRVQIDRSGTELSYFGGAGAARGVPLRYRRKHPGHCCLLGAVVRVGAARRLGSRHRDPVHDPPASPPARPAGGRRL